MSVQILLYSSVWWYLHICRNEILRYWLATWVIQTIHGNYQHEDLYSRLLVVMDSWIRMSMRMILQVPGMSTNLWHQWLRSYLSQGFPVDWTLDSFEAPLHSKKIPGEFHYVFCHQKGFRKQKCEKVTQKLLWINPSILLSSSPIN